MGLPSARCDSNPSHGVAPKWCVLEACGRVRLHVSVLEVVWRGLTLAGTYSMPNLPDLALHPLPSCPSAPPHLYISLLPITSPNPSCPRFHPPTSLVPPLVASKSLTDTPTPTSHRSWPWPPAPAASEWPPWSHGRWATCCTTPTRRCCAAGPFSAGWSPLLGRRAGRRDGRSWKGGGGRWR